MKQKPKPKPVGKQLQVHQAINDALLRVGMPSSPEAEKGLLMSFFAQNDLLDRTHKEEWFHNPRNLACYRAMVHVRRTGRPVEYVGVARKLFMDGIMEEGPALAFTSELDKGNLASPQLYSHYLEIILGDHLSRAAIQGGINMMEAGYGDPHTVSQTAQSELGKIAAVSSDSEKPKSMDEKLDEWATRWEEMASGKRSSAMPTRWRNWNAKVIGIRPGYTAITGPAKSGKSVLLQNIMTDACIRGGRPGILKSYEMSEDMVINRIIADLANIHGAYLFNPDVCPPLPGMNRIILQHLDIIRKSKLEIIHDVSMNLRALATKVKGVYAKHGDCVLGVDYIQIAPDLPGSERDNRERVVAANSAVLRHLSKELSIPVFGLSQLNAEGVSRESMSIEQDVDDCFRVERWMNKDGSYTDRGILCTRNRNGPPGHIDLKLDGTMFRFRDNTGTPDIP